MDFKNYTPEMKAILITSLEDKIADYERKISDAKIMINDIGGIEYKAEKLQPIVTSKSTTKQRKPRDGGWFEKIKVVLQKSNEPLTSREVLDKIVEEFQEVPNDATSMGSISPALRTAAKDGLLIKHKTVGEFARFELANKNVIDFQNAVNQ